MPRTVSAFLLAFVAVCATHVHVAVARSSYQTEIPNGDKVVRNGAPWPAVGHMTAAGGDARNTFGAAFAAAGNTWTSALCQADTDGDGYSNGAELGDPACRWAKGDVPERSVDIAHPGFADSQPSISAPSFRIVGPNAFEGVLQARIYPKPWGTVNFGAAKAKPNWARDFCRKAFALDAGRLARAWVMADRPSADRQYMPASEYVAISDPKGCTEVDMMTCAFTYSDVGSPQNTTQARTDAIYVDCRYNDNTGEATDFLPARLNGPDEGRGVFQVYMKDADGQSDWVWAKPNVAASPNMPVANFVCERLLGHPAGTFAATMASTWPNFLDYVIATPPCALSTKLVDCDIDFDPEIDVQDGEHAALFFDCVGPPTPLANNFTGPSRLELVAQINEGTDQTTFAALVAATYPGVNAGDVNFRHWRPRPALKAIFAAFHITASSATLNPSEIVKRIAADDSAAFGVIASRFENVPDDSGQPAAVPKFRLDGPSPHKGLLQARHNDNDPWGLVNWRSSAAWAKTFCRLANATADGWITLLAPQSTVDEAGAHVPADGFMSLTDPGPCAEEGNLASCNWLWSTKSNLRNASNASSAMWLDCKWSKYPESRLVWYTPCMGNLEVKMYGSDKWEPAWTDLPVRDVCEMTGCSCDTPRHGSTTTKCGHLKQQQYDASYFLHNCDLSDRGSCSITTHKPPTKYHSNAFQCPWFPYWSPTTKIGGHWVAGQIERFVYMVLNGTYQTIPFIQGCIGDFHSIPHDWVVVEHFEQDRNANLTHIRVHFEPEYLVATLLRRLYYDGLQRCLGALSESQAERWSKLQVRPAFNKFPGPGPLLKLAGKYPWEGFVMARFNGTEWGKITSEDGEHANTWPTGDMLCRSVDQYRMDKVSRVYRAKEDWIVRPGAADNYANPWDYMALFNLACQWDQDRHLHQCNYQFNTLTQTASTSTRFNGADDAFYVNCHQDPYPYRLVGAFPGMGFLELKDEQGNWTELDVSEIAPKDLCAKLAAYPSERGFVPYNEAVPAPKTWFDLSAKACADPLLPGWKCPLYFRRVRLDERYGQYCTRPPATMPFGGASVTLMNAAVKYDGTQTVATFKAQAAAVIGVTADQILIRQWRPSPDQELVHVTVGVNATGMNIAVKLGDVAADPATGVLRSDIRAFPVPADVLPRDWDWALESSIGASTPSRGNVIARPTEAFPFGVPCAQKWTQELTNAFCGTVFGAAAMRSAPRAPYWQVQPLDNDALRTLYLEDVRCLNGTASILNCSYGYASYPSLECPGNANVFVDCMPGSATVTKTVPLPAVKPSVSATVPLTTPPPPPTTTTGPAFATTTTVAPNNGTATDPAVTATAAPITFPGPGTTGPATTTGGAGATGTLPPAPGTGTAAPATTRGSSAPGGQGTRTKSATATVVVEEAPAMTLNVSRTIVPMPDVPQAAPLADEVAIDKEPAGAAAAATTAAAGTAMAMLGGPADLSDLQVLAMASELSCSQAVAEVAPPNAAPASDAAQEGGGDSGGASATATAAKSKARSSVLTPLTSVGLDVWALDLRALIGSFLLVIIFTVVHRIGVAIFGLVTSRSAQEAAPLAYYPNVPLAIFLALSQGMIVAALRLVLRPEMLLSDRAFGLVATVVMLVVVAFIGKRRITPELIVGKRAFRGRFILHDTWDGSGAAAGIGTYFGHPVGFWSPAFTQKSFGACFSQLRPASATFTADRPPGSPMEVPLLRSKSAGAAANEEAAGNDIRTRSAAVHVVRPLLFGLCAAIPFESFDGCDAQYGLTCLAALVMAVLVAVLKPYRWAPANWLLATASLTLALVCGLSLSAVPLGLRDSVRLDVIIVAVAGLLMIGKIGGVVTMLRERGWKRERLEQYEKTHGLGGVPTAGVAPSMPATTGGNGPAPSTLGLTMVDSTQAPLLVVPPTSPPPAHVASSDHRGSSNSGSSHDDLKRTGAAPPPPEMAAAVNPLSVRERNEL